MKSPNIASNATNRRRLERGFSLVELMVALVIGLIVLLVVGTLFVNSRQTYLMQDANSRLQENARYATELLGRQIRGAGYPATNFNPMAVNLALADKGLFATPSSTQFSGTRLSGEEGGAKDSITLSFDGSKDCLGAAATQPKNTFRINASSQLECFSMTTGNVGAVLDDVEEMQIGYRERNKTTYDSAGAVSMDKVVAVRICFLLRAKADGDKRAVESGVSQTFVDCSGTSVNKSDGYIRRAITTTVALRNPYIPS